MKAKCPTCNVKMKRDSQLGMIEVHEETCSITKKEMENLIPFETIGVVKDENTIR